MAVKEKSCLVTQNLIEKVRWAMEAPSVVIKEEKGGDGHTTWKEKALEDLRNSLMRIKDPFPEAAKRGVDFEEKVYKVVSSGRSAGSGHFQMVCDEVRGFQFYQKGNRTVEMDGLKIFFYAKYDAILPDKSVIKDIKTTENYKLGKYTKGIQHKIYCYVSGAKHFEYIIAEWLDYPKIRNVHKEIYVAPNDEKVLENDLLATTKECFDVIKDLGLWEAYRNTYCLY